MPLFPKEGSSWTCRSIGNVQPCWSIMSALEYNANVTQAPNRRPRTATGQTSGAGPTVRARLVSVIRYAIIDMRGAAVQRYWPFNRTVLDVRSRDAAERCAETGMGAKTPWSGRAGNGTTASGGWGGEADVRNALDIVSN